MDLHRYVDGKNVKVENQLSSHELLLGNDFYMVTTKVGGNYDVITYRKNKMTILSPATVL